MRRARREERAVTHLRRCHDQPQRRGTQQRHVPMTQEKKSVNMTSVAQHMRLRPMHTCRVFERHPLICRAMARSFLIGPACGSGC